MTVEQALVKYLKERPELIEALIKADEIRERQERQELQILAKKIAEQPGE